MRPRRGNVSSVLTPCSFAYVLSLVSCQCASLAEKCHMPRYKIVCQVTLGQRKDQGMRFCSRCLWDTNTDNYATASFKNVRVPVLSMCYITCFGVRVCCTRVYAASVVSLCGHVCMCVSLPFSSHLCATTFLMLTMASDPCPPTTHTFDHIAAYIASSHRLSLVPRVPVCSGAPLLRRHRLRTLHSLNVNMNSISIPF